MEPSTSIARTPRERCGCGIPLPGILKSLNQPAAVIGADFRIVAANAAYRERFAGGDTVCGRKCHEVSHGYRRPCEEVGVSCPVRQSLRTRTACRVLHVHQTGDGDVQEEVATYPVEGENGAVGAFLEILTPIAVGTRAHGAGRPRLVGRSPAFHGMLDLVNRVAPTDSPVLLLGESGTGKELVARAIHETGRRAGARFVPLDCSGLTETLFESELFGHERGAFTGATGRKLGLVESCDGGTLFLDEIGDVPLSMQVKLLRLIETGTFRRVGSTELRRTDFRLVCATHRDLRRMMEAEQFRHDLFYRIATFPIRLPPLRERLEDLPVLVEALREELRLCNKVRIPDEVLRALGAYDFPGNVRELRNVLERACLLADGGEIEVAHLPERIRAAASSAPPPSASAAPSGIVPLSEHESRYLRRVLASFRGDKKQLARSLGLSERTLYRKLRAVREST